MTTETEDWDDQARVTMLQETQVSDDSPENTQPAQDPVAAPPESSSTMAAAAADSQQPALECQPSPKSLRSTSPSHIDPEPGFAHVDGDIGGPGYNETKVDIIAVPCPGADPVETWARDPLPEGYFGLPQHTDHKRHSAATELAEGVILSPAINRHLPPAAHLWVRQGIRKSISTARVMLYRHRALTEGLTLEDLAQDLVERVWQLREGSGRSRPIFFIAHSIGGLVVKLALLIASKMQMYRPIMYNCHGVTFFATPHRGSSYMSMKNLRGSIQDLLGLQRPLPRSIAERLRLSDKWLLKVNSDFLDIASELRIWTIYETIDSQLSGTNGHFTTEVQFGAPLVSIKSGILGVRQENVYPVDSDHAHCASFGKDNLKTMATYLGDLSKAVAKAEALSALYVHTPLRLKDHVKVELIGFYDDPDSEVDIRLYFIKYHLSEFIRKGPEKCLEERLGRLGRPAGRGPIRLDTSPDRGRSGIIPIPPQLQDVLSHMPFWRSTSKTSEQGAEPEASPPIVVTGPSSKPSMVGSRSAPGPTSRPIHSLTVPALESPGFYRPSSRMSDGTASSTQSEPAPHEPTVVDDHGAHSDEETKLVSTAEAGDVDPAFRRRAERAHRLSRNAALADLTAGFSRPNAARRKFMWIHLPFNNPLWVKDIFEVLSQTHNKSFSKLFNNENWVSRHVQGRHSLSQPSFIRPACNYISAESPSSPRASPSGSRPPSSSPNRGSPSYLYLYMPYLHFDTYVSMIRRRNLINRRLRHGRARPVPKDVAELESLELRVVWEYLSFDPPLNFRRTLDQFGYPSLKDTCARDDDQMLYKLTKREPSEPPPGSVFLENNQKETKTPVRSPLAERLSSLKDDWLKTGDETSSEDNGSVENLEKDLKDGNVLMIDQLWLWAIDTTTLATFFPKRESSPLEGTLFQQGDLRNSIYNELNGDLTGRTENALDLAAFITLHAVTVLLDRTSHPDLEIFRIFEEAIGMLTEGMTSNLKRFRMQSFREMSDDSDSDDPEEYNAKSIKQRHKREVRKAERENRENTSAMLELRDMEDELMTLTKLFETQEAAVKTMRTIYTTPDLKDITRNGQGYLEEALQKLDGYKSQTTEMLRRVDTTRKDQYEKMLEMAQRQAQVDDVRWSRLQTELASSQNLSVMIFTIFTVLFLPLSFFTGLFGMNTSDWAGDLVPSLSDIGAIALPTSFVLIIVTLMAAFSSRVQTVFRIILNYFKHTYRGGLEVLGSLEPQPRRDANKRRKEDKRRKRTQASKTKEKTYDFWATVKKQRESFYEIPDLNRQTPDTGVRRKGTWLPKESSW
ncbi:hypothetical protein GQ53DRAFT_386984 [Thozetella sp. PMI_491]|nr:hypothetical protein GQ53DRAFT_386984 [Thozetella sp. PMI_491]